MSDVLIFHDSRAALFELIDGSEHVARVVDGVPDLVPVRASYHVLADERGGIEGDPQVVITQDPGTQGDIDRVDRVTLECYAPGEQAINILNSILGVVVDSHIETPSGIYVDRIDVDQTPHELQYPSDTINLAACRLLVTVSPV